MSRLRAAGLLDSLDPHGRPLLRGSFVSFQLTTLDCTHPPLVLDTAPKHQPTLGIDLSRLT